MATLLDHRQPAADTIEHFVQWSTVTFPYPLTVTRFLFLKRVLLRARQDTTHLCSAQLRLRNLLAGNWHLEHPKLHYKMQTQGHVLLWLLLTQAHKLAESAATCKVPSVPRGTPTHVTCHFSEDLVQTKKAFAIHKYDKKDHFEEILNCPWIENQHICDSLAGYEFDGHITDEVTLKIPSASEENVGRYVCQVVPSDTDNLAPCNFTLEEITTSAVTFTEETTTIFIKQEGDEEGNVSLLPILLPVFLIVVVVVVVIVVMIFMRQRIPKRLRKLLPFSNREEDEEDTQEEREYGAQFKIPCLGQGSRSKLGDSEHGKAEVHTNSEEAHTESDGEEAIPLLDIAVANTSPLRSFTRENELKEPKEQFPVTIAETAATDPAMERPVIVDKSIHSLAKMHSPPGLSMRPGQQLQDSKQGFSHNNAGMLSVPSEEKAERAEETHTSVTTQRNADQEQPPPRTFRKEDTTPPARPPVGPQYTRKPDQAENSKLKQPSVKRHANEEPLADVCEEKLPNQTVSRGINIDSKNVTVHKEVDKSQSTQFPAGPLTMAPPESVSGPTRKLSESNQGDLRTDQSIVTGQALPTPAAGPGHSGKQRGETDHLPKQFQQDSVSAGSSLGHEQTVEITDNTGKDTRNGTTHKKGGDEQSGDPMSEASPLRPSLSSEQLGSEDASQNQPTQTLHALPPDSVSSEAKEKPLTEETDRKPPTDLPPETEDKSSIRAPARKRDTKELFTAISENDVEKVRKVLDKGVNVNSRETKGERPLHVACRHGSESVLEILLERGANIEATDNRGLTPLHWACIYGKPAIVNLMISRRANVKAVGEDGATALHLACQNGLKVILEILLQARSEIEAKDRNGLTPLHWACKNGKTAAIETLIDCGADVNAKGNDGTTPFHIACENEQYAVLNILLANGYDVEAKDKQGMTALGWACKHGKEPLAKMLVDKGADANARAEDGTTPLHVASQTGKEGVIETLLSAGSDIEATDKTGMTPLHWACKTGQETPVKTLLAHGSKVNAREHDDWTPLHLACQKGSKEIVLLLHKHNADVEAKTLKHELTAKDVARRRLNKDIVELLGKLSKGNRPDTDDKGSMKLKR